MNPNAKLWTDALRSGEYQQTAGTMHRHTAIDHPTGHCCLGVACEVYSQANPGRLSRYETRDWTKFTASDDPGGGSHDVLPGIVRDWLGLRTDEGEIEGGNTLTNLNDTGSTFDEIADIIDAEPDGLFV